MTNILLARGSPCPRQSRHCESGLLEQMSTLYCYKVKASACSGNQQFKLISKEYRFTYKYIFCARKASRIFHRYALYIEVSAVARGKRSVFPERFISQFKSKKYESLLFQLCSHLYTNMQHPIIFSPFLVTLTTNYCNGWR